MASKFIFGTAIRNLLALKEERGISVTFVDGRDPRAWESAIRPETTRLFFFEPVGNPGMERVDKKAVADIAHLNGRDILVVADISMTPLDHSLSRGADIVVLSTTKLLGGGAILLSQAGFDRLHRIFPDQTAGYPVLIKVGRKGLTQSHRRSHAMLCLVEFSILRMQRQTQTASCLATTLNQVTPNQVVKRAALDQNAPPLALSSIFSLDPGAQNRAFRIIDLLAARGIGIVNNFGSTRTTVIHPGTTTQSSLSVQEQAEQGISPGLVRVSVGVESLPFLTKTFVYAMRQSTVSPI